jgi:hypothetical protein
MRTTAADSLTNLKNLRASLQSKMAPWKNISSGWVALHTSVSNLSNREVYMLSVQMRRWCRDNCRDQYSILNGSYAFKNPKDAFHFQLRFGQHMM